MYFQILALFNVSLLGLGLPSPGRDQAIRPRWPSRGCTDFPGLFYPGFLTTYSFAVRQMEIMLKNDLRMRISEVRDLNLLHFQVNALSLSYHWIRKFYLYFNLLHLIYNNFNIFMLEIVTKRRAFKTKYSLKYYDFWYDNLKFVWIKPIFHHTLHYSYSHVCDFKR